MSVYLHKGSPFYHFDFRLKGRRFHGSTGRTNRREAEQVERAERERAAQALTAEKACSVSLQLDHIIGRYWQEVGQHHSGSDNTWRDLCRLADYFTPTKLLSEIGDDEVASLVAWRRGHRVRRNKKVKLEDCPLISPATVNRSTTEILRKLFVRAKTAWGARLDREPNWRVHMLAEPQERVRELVGDEAEKLEEATREDYAPFFGFAKASGLRLRECLLKWPEVNWDTRRITKLGKGGKLVTAPITREVWAILWPLRKDHPTDVFTYVAKRKRGGRLKGQRYPLTYSGVKTAWRRLRAKAGVSDFRFHDYRHDLATKMLRHTGNLKLVQRLLNHRDLKTTHRYAHVQDSEVADALESHTESRKKSRNELKKAI